MDDFLDGLKNLPKDLGLRLFSWIVDCPQILWLIITALIIYYLYEKSN